MKVFLIYGAISVGLAAMMAIGIYGGLVARMLRGMPLNPFQ